MEVKEETGHWAEAVGLLGRLAEVLQGQGGCVSQNGIECTHGVIESDTEVTCKVRLAIQKVRTSRTRAARHALALNSGWLRRCVDDPQQLFW